MEMTAVLEERKSKSSFPLFQHCLGKLSKNASFPHSHSFGDDLDFHFLQVRLTSTLAKSVTYMPGTFCYRHARSHRGQPMRALAPEVPSSFSICSFKYRLALYEAQ